MAVALPPVIYLPSVFYPQPQWEHACALLQFLRPTPREFFDSASLWSLSKVKY